MTLLPRDDPKLAAYRASCTLDTCPLRDSYFSGYLPSLPTNIVFLALFSLSLCGFILQAALSRRFIGFSIAMISGVILEVLGYIGRIMSHHNPFRENPFLLQIICLTIAPAFLAAGIYLTLSRIVLTFGSENSRIKPLSYPRIFIPCDVLSLLLQAAGGGIASVASHQNKSPAIGDHIMVAGLAFQVFTLLVFQLLCLDFAIRTARRMRAMGDAALDTKHAALRSSARFKSFLAAMVLATICIFIRSIYRVAELSEGWNGALIKNQRLFIAFEGAMVVVAVIVLNLAHPGYCFREGYVQRKYRNLFKRKKANNEKSAGVVDVKKAKKAAANGGGRPPQRNSDSTSADEKDFSKPSLLDEPDFPDFIQRGRMNDQAFVIGPKKAKPQMSSKTTMAEDDDLFVTPRTSLGGRDDRKEEGEEASQATESL